MASVLKKFPLSQAVLASSIAKAIVWLINRKKNTKCMLNCGIVSP